MKKILALLLALTALLSLSACGARDLDAPSGYKQASSDEYCDYVLYVPSAWNAESAKTNLTTAAVPVGNSKLTVSVAKLESRAVNAKGEPIETLAQYWDDCKDEYAYLTNSTVNEAKSETIRLGTKWEEAEKAKAHTAYRYVFAGDYQGTSYTFAQVFVLNGSDLYCITMTVATEHYTDETIKTFNDILSYFLFK